MSTAIDMQLAITATIIVGAKWQRGARDIERQFLMPLHVRGTAEDCLPRLIENLESMMRDLIHNVEAADKAASRGFTYRFPRMMALMEPEGAKPGTIYPTIPEPTQDQRDAVAAMLKPQA